MHEILIISGKGGTGKTSLTAAFAHLCQDVVLCDLDVDAPDLHLVLAPQPSPKTAFFSGAKALIESQKCQACGLCKEMCRFNAVTKNHEAVFGIDPLRCEGCYVCVQFCPHDAIAFIPNECGYWRTSQTRFGPLVHAQLYPGEENSGKLVALLRHEARRLAASKGADILLSDGPPGIGCPVISALSGMDLVIIVTEPTPSGKHDLDRVLQLCEHFRLPSGVVVNKSDLNTHMLAEIKTICRNRKVPLLAKIPHSADFVSAMVNGQAITEYTHTHVTAKLRMAWNNISQLARNRNAA